MTFARKQDSGQGSSSVVFRDLAQMIYEASGINLKSGKEFLMETRLSRRVSELRLQGLDQYVSVIKADPEELKICVEMLTTHKTEWFREILHYQWLKKELPRLRRPGECFQIWSAACSTGPEVYSLMLLMLKEGLRANEFRILGSDISRPALARAESLPESEEFEEQIRLLRARCPDWEKTRNEMDLALSQSVRFKEFNLVDSHLGGNPQFDVIFLRNVLIYFDRATVNKVCRRLSNYLRPGGHLVLGLSESLQGELPEYVSLGQSIYRYQPK